MNLTRIKTNPLDPSASRCVSINSPRAESEETRLKYFIHDPNNDTDFYTDKAVWEKAMQEFDAVGAYCDDGWSEDVVNVIAGIIPAGISRCEDEESDDFEEEWDYYRRHATHRMTECNRRDRPDDVDENGDSESTGDTWLGDWDYICDYQFAPIVAKAAA